MNAKVEFSLERSRSYKSALKKYPDAWEEDSLLMLQYLAPSKTPRGWALNWPMTVMMTTAK